MTVVSRAFLYLVLLVLPRLLLAGERPLNLLFVTSDDQRWDAAGVAGNPAIHTPVIDRLADEGIYFTQATVNVSQCLPIRGTLLTGRTAHAHGAYAHQYQRPEAKTPSAFSDWPTVPSLLREAGYETVLVGKWHLASDPWLVGFERTLAWIPGGAQRFLDPDMAYGESRELKKVPGYTQEILADAAIGFLAGRDAEAPPFALWLAFTAPHSPFGPNPERIEALYRDRADVDLLPPGFPRDIPTNDWRHYVEAVSHFDEQLGRVLDALHDHGLADSTVIVFLGDNGFMMGERGVGVAGGQGKVVPYESSIRVPMLLRVPGRQRVSGLSGAAVSSLDVPPTLLALAGIEPPASWPGRSLLPLLESTEAPGFEDAFSEWVDDQSPVFGSLAHRLVRTPTHKLIVWEDASRSPELYDLVADPREETNLFGEPERRALAADLLRRLLGWMERTGDPGLDWPHLRELREQLALATPAT